MAEDSRPPMLARASEENSLYSGATSTCLRALALAVIAVSWLFLHDGQSSASQTLTDARKHPLLTWSLTLAVAALALDAFQYAVGALLSQWNENMLEQVVRDPTLRESTWRTDFAWQRAANTGLVDALLRATKKLEPALERNRERAATKAREIMSDHYSHLRGSTTKDSSYDDDEDALLVAFLAHIRPGRGLVGATRTLFWLKTGACVVAGALLLIFCGADLLR